MGATVRKHRITQRPLHGNESRMAWVRLDDGFSDHPKLAALGDLLPLAGWLYVCGLCYAARHLTNGLIPRTQLARLAGFNHLAYMPADGEDTATYEDQIDPNDLAEALAEAGLWHRHDEGYIIHDYLKYNPSRTQVERKRVKNIQRQQVFRGKYRNAVSNAHVTPLVTPLSHVSPSPSQSPSHYLKTKIKTKTAPDGAFPVFWGQIPKKKAKRDAEKAWKTLNPSPALVETIMAGLTRALASEEWTREGGRYIPYPATWLRGRRWEDEYTPTYGHAREETL